MLHLVLYLSLDMPPRTVFSIHSSQRCFNYTIKITDEIILSYSEDITFIDINEGDIDSAMDIKEIDPVSETETPKPTKKELKILKHYFPDLISTLTDIDNLLPHCVKEEIIDFQEISNISAEKLSSSHKVKKLLEHVSGPLKSGNCRGFYDLLKIMKSEGKPPTKDLANKMEKSLN